MESIVLAATSWKGKRKLGDFRGRVRNYVECGKKKKKTICPLPSLQPPPTILKEMNSIPAKLKSRRPKT